MIKLEALQHLCPHSDYLTSVFWHQDIFFVWGVVRDLLLWLSTAPTDVDITSGWNPEEIFKKLTSDIYHLFRTEKFGTISVIPKEISLPWYEQTTDTSDTRITYELTPFRTEWGYADFRHPQEISRSSDLIADSKRRDFTINAMYAYVCDVTTSKTQGETPILATLIWSEEELSERLTTWQDLFFTDSNILLLQNHETITRCFAEGKLQHETLKEIINTSLHCTYTDTQNDRLIILIDPHHGIQDLITKTICTVWDPHQRFGEDALRILRWVRFANILNHELYYWPHAQYSPHEAIQHHAASFDFSAETRHSMKKNYYLVSYIAKERIKDEITKIFKKWNPFGYIALLQELNLLKILFPALAATYNVPQPVRYHAFDVYAHTLLTLHKLCLINIDYLVRLAMLYHDVGKTDQYYYFSQHITKEEKKLPITHQMYHAQALWPELAQKDFRALWFSNNEIETICRYIKYHHRPGELLDSTPEIRTKKLRQLLSEVGPDMLYNLMDIAIADRHGQYNPLQPAATAQLEHMKQQVQTMYAEEWRFMLKDLAVNGDTLMKELWLTPWPIIGELLEKAFNRVLSDVKERNIPSTILTYIKSLP